MIIGLLNSPQDKRVALIPDTVKKFLDMEVEVLVEQGAGDSAYYADASYSDVGAKLTTRNEVLAGADLIVSVVPPTVDEMSKLSEKQAVASLFNPLVNTELVEDIKKLSLRAFTLDRIPRTTIAQSMDVLSSMASLAGYKAVIMAADRLPGYFPMLMTAAGTIPPARVLILGAGVAGLQAIATARRLGATVSAFDVRSAVKEEVQSLGAKFVEVEGAQEDQAAGGYAVTQTEEYQQKQKALIHEHASKSDVIITTAQIPGRKAPLLIESHSVVAMKPGSVIVDLAAVSGGNCKLTQNDKTIEHHGVFIMGYSNLPGEMSNHASRMLSNNFFNYIKYVFPKGTEELDLENEIVQGTLIQ